MKKANTKKNGALSFDEKIKALDRRREKLQLQRQIAELRAKQKSLK
jgi:hypothetical protein